MYSLKIIIAFIVATYIGQTNANTSNAELGFDLIKCAAYVSVLSTKTPILNSSDEEKVINSRIKSEILLVKASSFIGKDKADAIYKNKRQYFARLLDEDYRVHETQHTELLKLCSELPRTYFDEEVLIQNKITVGDKTFEGYWINFYEKWEGWGDGKFKARDAYIFYLGNDGEFKKLVASIYNKKNKYFISSEPGFLLGKGKWRITADAVSADYKITHNTSSKYKNVLIHEKFISNYIIIGDKLLSQNKIFYKLDLSFSNLIDNDKILSGTNEEIDSLLESHEKENEVIIRALMGK